LLDDSDAVLSSDGATLHAEGDARTSEVRSALREAARRIDRARARSATDSPEEGLALWRALVDGRWSVVERFDSDGRRLFVARRNDPASREHRALDELERKLVALVALGHSQKMCAYEVGRSVSTVSALIRSATKKLGVRTRAELVALHGALVEEAAAGPPP
jgi:DNA-binding NarL/FixJ family response regulator